jgi:hypothetical protein
MIRFRPVSGATLIGGDPFPNFLFLSPHCFAQFLLLSYSGERPSSGSVNFCAC